MNVEIRAEAALFPEKEYIKGIFVAVQQAVKAPCGLIYGFLKANVTTRDRKEVVRKSRYS